MKTKSEREHLKRCDDREYTRLERLIQDSIITKKLKEQFFRYLGSIRTKRKRYNPNEILELILDEHAQHSVREIRLIPLNLYGYYDSSDGHLGYAVYVKNGHIFD